MSVVIRELGVVDYLESWHSMRDFCLQRGTETNDEIWFLQHFPVFTRGVSCHVDPMQNPLQIPVLDTDRGGQITYHGPGQLIAYLLIDLKRTRRGVRNFVCEVEQVIINALASMSIQGERIVGAPGVYVDGKKIAALGIRVKNGSTYHGLSINVNMDKSPFDCIHPCGYEGLKVLNISELQPQASLQTVQLALTQGLRGLTYR
ncbi:MAG: lipoyl(octanoyl) transferase [Parasphingorhabdus sp.]|jgi:lipoyl(octanoyl) transferase